MIIDFFNNKLFLITKTIGNLSDAAPPDAFDPIGQMCKGQDK